MLAGFAVKFEGSFGSLSDCWVTALFSTAASDDTCPLAPVPDCFRAVCQRAPSRKQSLQNIFTSFPPAHRRRRAGTGIGALHPTGARPATVAGADEVEAAAASPAAAHGQKKVGKWLQTFDQLTLISGHLRTRTPPSGESRVDRRKRRKRELSSLRFLRYLLWRGNQSKKSGALPCSPGNRSTFGRVSASVLTKLAVQFRAPRRDRSGKALTACPRRSDPQAHPPVSPPASPANR